MRILKIKNDDKINENSIYQKTVHMAPLSNQGFYIYKSGKTVTICARFVNVADLKEYVLPAEYRPNNEIASLIIYQDTNWKTMLGRIRILTTGSFVISKASSLPATFEDSTDGYATFCITYLTL